MTLTRGRYSSLRNWRNSLDRTKLAWKKSFGRNGLGRNGLGRDSDLSRRILNSLSRGVMPRVNCPGYWGHRDLGQTRVLREQSLLSFFFLFLEDWKIYQMGGSFTNQMTPGRCKSDNVEIIIRFAIMLWNGTANGYFQRVVDAACWLLRGVYLFLMSTEISGTLETCPIFQIVFVFRICQIVNVECVKFVTASRILDFRCQVKKITFLFCFSVRFDCHFFRKKNDFFFLKRDISGLKELNWTERALIFVRYR